MVVGRPPKDEGERRNQVPLTHGWVDVVDVPFGAAPGISHRPGGGAWSEHTKRWWAAVSSMPHCSLWRSADWEFARTTALVHAEVMEGGLQRAQELRVREAAMGTTFDSLRALRIRYVETVETPSAVVESDEVRARRDARRQRIIEEAG